MIDALLERVYARCIPDEHGCMNWRGAVQSKCRSPVVRNGGHAISLRRIMVEAKIGRPLGPMVATYLCGNPACVMVEHLGAVKRSTIQKRNEAAMNAMQHARKSHRIAVKARARAKLNPEIVRQIREADGYQRAIAKQFGVCQATVGAIKRGLTWRDMSNPFLRLAA